MELTIKLDNGTMITCNLTPYGITGDCVEYPQGTKHGVAVHIDLFDLINKFREKRVRFASVDWGHYDAQIREVGELLEMIAAAKRERARESTSAIMSKHQG